MMADGSHHEAAFRAILKEPIPCSLLGKQGRNVVSAFLNLAALSDRFVWTVPFIISAFMYYYSALGPGEVSVSTMA